ncbi:MAG: hypothetical protein ACRDQ9_17755 [Pseudonocardiaceae bacterium]
MAPTNLTAGHRDHPGPARVPSFHCHANGDLLTTFDALETAETDYRARRAVQQAQAELDRLTASPTSAGTASPLDPHTVDAGTELGVSGELAGELLRLMERLAKLMPCRRQLLHLLGWVMATAAGGLITPDEWERLVAVIETPHRVDAQTITTLATFLQHCKHQDDALGPSMVHGTVLAQYGLVRRLLPQCPAGLRPRLLSLRSDMAASIGDHLVDLSNHDRAQHYFRAARIAGHEAGNRVHAAYALTGASYSAYLRGEACTATDTAAAARNLAARTDDALLKVHADLRAAGAHALEGQHAACLAAYARAREGLAAAVPGVESPAYFVHSGTIESKLSGDLAQLGRPREALEAAQAAAKRFDPSFKGSYTRCQVRLATALVLCEEIGEAARVLGAAASTASTSPTPRLTAELRATRAQLQPWQNTHAVKTLDTQLTAYGIQAPNPHSSG